MTSVKRYELLAADAAKWLTLRVWFVFFGLVVCLGDLGFFALNAWRERDNATMYAQISAENLAESLAQQASDSFEAARGALAAVATRVVVDGTGAVARSRLRQTMSALVASMPRIHTMLVIDERGHLVVSDFTSNGKGRPSVLDRPFFRYHRSHRDTAVYVSGPARAKSDHDWVVFATRRLNHADGSFAGVVMAPISLRYFERSYASVDVGPTGTITLIAGDGTILFRRPLAYLGARYPDATLLRVASRTRKAGWYFSTSATDGAPRLHAFRRVPGFPLLVLVAFAPSDYLRAWRSETWANTALLGCIIATFVAMASILAAQIASRKRAEAALAVLALRDGLTDLANRRQFDIELQREWGRGARHRSTLSLLMLDVDNFKVYNDRYGHVAGDAALVAVAGAIGSSVLRPTDVAARYGGEEFAIILPSTDARGAEVIAERVRAAVAARHIPHEANGTHGIVSVSIGVATMVPAPNGSSAALIAAADRALYDAKRTGRNRTVVATVPALPAPHDPA